MRRRRGHEGDRSEDSEEDVGRDVAGDSEDDSRVANGRPDDEVSGEPVGEVRVELVLEPADLVIDLPKDKLLDLPVELANDELSDLPGDVLSDKLRNEPGDVLLDEPADIPAKKLNDLLFHKPADELLEVPIHEPSPGRPTWVEITQSMSVLATSAYVRMRAIRKELSMAVKSIRRGLNRETRALLEYIRKR
jgi:hypothetical protein